MMPIPIEVSYTTIGRKKTRNVVGVICPTVLNQRICKFKSMPIYVNMGDANVDWEETSAGFRELERVKTFSIKNKTGE